MQRKSNILQQKDENTINSLELGTQLKTIKEEGPETNQVEARGPKPSWLKKVCEVDSQTDTV